MRAPGVLVVGGGVIGCALARRLARAGHAVLVVERDEPGSHATWAAAGMLAPLAEADEPGPFLDLLRASRALHPALAAELREETGIDVGYRDEGSILVASEAAEVEALERRHAWQSTAGFPVERLTPAEAVRQEPALAPDLLAALRFPEDHQVDNRLLGRALWRAAERAGARFRTGETVRAVAVEGGRATGVVLDSGERLPAGAVVVAAGSWAGALQGLPRPLPVTPVLGQLLALRTDPHAFRQVIHSARGYLVPRADGRLLVGATVERVGFREGVTAAGILNLLGTALALAPSLAGAPLLECWSGLRPGTPDGLPILGADPEADRLYHATGHYRNGILLAPITAELLAREIEGARVDALAPFSLARFRPGGAVTPSGSSTGTTPGSRHPTPR